MGRAGYTAAEISSVSEHTDMNTLEKYKKLANITQAADRHKVGLILAPSGRQQLRGASNKFGVVAAQEKSIYRDISITDGNSSERAGSSNDDGSPCERSKQVTFDLDNQGECLSKGVAGAPFSVGQRVFAKVSFIYIYTHFLESSSFLSESQLILKIF